MCMDGQGLRGRGDTPAPVSIKEVFEVILKTGHSRFPILESNASDIAGFIHVKDLFQLMNKKRGARSLKSKTITLQAMAITDVVNGISKVLPLPIHEKGCRSPNP